MAPRIYSLTVEELVARQERVRELKRASNRRFYVKSPETYHTYYEANKTHLNHRKVERQRERRVEKAAANAALPEL